MRHILLNLLSNAIKYSPEGGNIGLMLSCEQGKAVFQIQDEGIGIPLADRKQLFQIFQRGRNVGKSSGTGLGLCIVKKCIDLHGGEITLESQVGEGTTFTVTLPLVSNSAALI
ncbi:MAG TPA: sensor histidine kinase [Allocoleopsis sp.]